MTASIKPDPPPSPLVLFLRFLRLGSTAFGGPAMVAYIRTMAVERERWLDSEGFKQGVAICQTIPGATAMQVAAYAGLRAAGAWGAVAAYAGFGLPAFVLMVVLAALYQESRDLAVVVSAFNGLQVVVVALVVHATVHFGRTMVRNGRDAALALPVAAFLFLGGHPILALGLAALIGIPLFSTIQPPLATIAQQNRPLAWRQLMPALLLCMALGAGLALLAVFQHRLFELALLMIRVDLFAFGGGYGSVPLMFNEVVTVKGWMTSQTFMDGIALGQVTPGPIVITATFVGFLQAGLTGAVAATIAIFAPSLIILFAVVPVFDRMRSHVFFQRGMHGILVSFAGLLLSVSLRFGLAIPWDMLRVGLAALALVALWRKVDILWVVLAGTLLAVLFL